MRRPLRGLLAALATVSLLAPTAALADMSDEPTPIPTPARLGPPASVGVLGDSISAATGADGRSTFDSFVPAAGSTRPERSWATGNQYADLQSVFQRTRTLRAPQPTGRANLSENGARAQNILAQVQRSPADIGYLLIQIGGNDLCRPTVDQMTPVETYRQQIDDTLAWIDDNRPDALVQLNSVPDIYRLWEIRRTNAIAILFWASGVIPCQSLLASPTSTSPEDMARREQVRQHGLAYNDALREVCDAYVRCRYDDDATWLFSNDPATFVNGDISNQDHFHPSYSGQVKLAEVSWHAGFDFTDTAAPDVTFALGAAPSDAGWHRDEVEVTVTAADDAAVAGIETRIHTGGTTSAWTQQPGDQATVTVADDGLSHVEARAVDVNGNVSASAFQTVRIDTVAPTVTIDVPADGGEVVLGTEVEAAYSCDDDRSGVASCTGTQAPGELLATGEVGPRTFTVTAEDAAGNVTTETVTYRVVYALSAAGDRVDVDGPIEIRSTATLPVRVSLADAAGAQVPGLAPTLTLVGADGEIDAGTLTYDPVEDRYGANLSLRRLGVAPGVYDLVVGLDDGTTRAVVELIVH